jgi:broad specificity phosphatase PhoE
MKKNSSTVFYIVRHAEAENNIKEIIGANSDLTEKGINQAKKIAKKFSKINFDVIFTSDLDRAQHTAEIIANDQINKSVIIDKNLRERNYGKYEGESMEKYREETKDILDMMKNMTDKELLMLRRYESFETDYELMDRLIGSLKKYANQYTGGKVLVVTHGLVIRTLLVSLGFATYKNLPAFSVKNTGYAKLEYNNMNFLLKETVDIDNV